jgi:hypothetical protein
VLPAVLRAVEPDLCTRVVELSPRKYRLEVAWRTFHATGKPDVLLAGMVHLGSPDFYEHAQEILASQPFILYENTSSIVPEPPEPEASDDEKKTWTKSALTYVAELVLGYQVRFRTYPDSIDVLAWALKPNSIYIRDLRKCMTDGWGHPVTYTKTESGFLLSSNGIGITPDPDLTLDRAPYWRWNAAGSADQPNKFARSYGLMGQLDGGIDYDHPNFHGIDMPGDQYHQLMAAAKPNPAPHFAATDTPGDFESRKYPNDIDLRRFVFVELNGTARHQPLEPQSEDYVTFIERNDVVWAALCRRIAKSEPTCVFYGAGHDGDLEQRLVGEQGYAPGETQWLAVCDADLSKSQVTDAEIASMKSKAQLGQLSGD